MKKQTKFQVNKEIIDIFDQYINSGKRIIMSKSRQTGKSSVTVSIIAWKKLYDKYDRRRLRKESIKRIFNI